MNASVAAASDTAALLLDESLPEIPTPGRVVTVRGSTWAVTDVRSQGLPRSPADETRARTQHLVALQSLEEDRLGEELTVVWELEIGHSVDPERGLPETLTVDTFDEPDLLGAVVDAVRWGAVTSADDHAYQAPFRSGANIEAYQLEPLARALRAPRTNLLLADDVGLGKTIEAGLVIQELLLRHRARTAVIVCPPSLALKWQDEMREKFGLDFVVVDSALMTAVRRTHGLAANPLRLHPRVILSMAWLPGPRAQRLVRDVADDATRADTARRYAFDILVVDEAHHVAPSSPSAVGGGRGYAVDSQRTIATRALAELCEHRLFLTATPHNGYSESFTALLEMVDDRRFSRGASLDRAALADVTVRRLKSDLTGANGLGFPPRHLKTLSFEPADDETAAFDTLHALLTESARRNGRERSGDLVAMLLKKRFLSSPWAFARTLELYAGTAAHGSLPDLEEDEHYQEVLGSGGSDEEEGEQAQPEFRALRASKGSDPLSAATAADVDALVAWGRGFEHRPDSRLDALLTFLEAVCRPDGRNWTNERVVVFTEYTATLQWAVRVLESRGLGGDRLATITGATDTETREIVRARFTAHPAEEPVRILLATDAAGEGIDLQDHCHRLVNLDIPFNPSRLEQRLGRIDRYGQRHEPQVFTFAPAAASSRYGTDLDFLRRIVRKVETVKADLGSVNEVVDADVLGHFAPGRRGAARTAAQRRDADVITGVLAAGLTLNRELTALSESYAERREQMHLTPVNARRVVDTALTLDHQPTLVEVGDEHTDAEVFEVPTLSPRWQPALAGLATRLHPDRLRPVTFDDEAARGRTALVHAHLGHPLLQKAARLLRTALLRSDSRLHRATAVVVPGLPVSCVASVSRLVLVGRGGLRLHEEVFVTGVRFRGHQLAEGKVHDLLDQALDAADLRLASPAVRRALAGQWSAPDSALRTRLAEATARRAQRRREAVADRLAERCTGDVARAEEIFEAFRGNLRDSLQRLHDEELDAASMLAFADDQRRQRALDVRRMEERLATLDDEERREVAALRTRYADVRAYVTTAAVVFAVAPEDAQSWETGR